MKTLFLSLLLMSPLSALASVNSCEPLELSSAKSVLCGRPEMEAMKQALSAGILNDVKTLIINNTDIAYGKTEPTVTCKQEPMQVIRLGVLGGNHGKTVDMLVTVKVVCDGTTYVNNPYNLFPVFVTVWTSQDESEVGTDGYLVVKKLYEAQ